MHLCISEILVIMDISFPLIHLIQVIGAEVQSVTEFNHVFVSLSLYVTESMAS